MFVLSSLLIALVVFIIIVVCDKYFFKLYFLSEIAEKRAEELLSERVIICLLQGLTLSSMNIIPNLLSEHEED